MWRCIGFCCEDKVCAQQRGEEVEADRISPGTQAGLSQCQCSQARAEVGSVSAGVGMLPREGKRKKIEERQGGVGRIELSPIAVRDCRTSGSAASQDRPAVATCAGRQSQGDQTCTATAPH